MAEQPPQFREPPIEGHKAIAAVLTELWGVPVSADASYRLSCRARHPLPVDGYGTRVWTTRSRIVSWVDAERSRRGRAPVTSVQLQLFDGGKR